MAVRIRPDGTIWCAAMHPEQEGDIYINDGLHYLLSVEAKVLVTQRHEQHQLSGQWWWVTEVPSRVAIDPFYLQK